METDTKYSKLSIQELLIKENELKKHQKIAVVFCVIMTLSTFFQVYMKSTGLWSSWLILMALFFMMKFGGDLKKVQDEIKKR